MAATSANIGYGSTFGIEGGTPGTYVDVAEVISITPPPLSRNAIEATHLESDNGYEESIAGIMRAGEAVITVNYVPAASASDPLFTAFEAATDNFEITFPNGIRLQFAGVVTGYEVGEISVEGKMEVTFSIKATGQPSILAAA